MLLCSNKPNRIMDNINIQQLASNKEQALLWWAQLSKDWQYAFAIAFFNQTVNYQNLIPTFNDLKLLFNSSVLRLVGKKGVNPNLPFILTDLSGLELLTNLQMLFISGNAIKSLQPIRNLDQLNTLIVNENELESLEGIEKLVLLEKLYCQYNQISSLKPLQNLINLTFVQCNFNQLKNFEGINEQHIPKLETFIALPNKGISLRDLDRVRYDLNIECRRTPF